ncbi:MAG: hypothetical protein SNI51_01655 [Rikenellaceae bacterium]
MKNIRKKSIKIGVITLLFALLGVAVMLLWNTIIPNITGWGSLSYWQALGLLALSRILTGRVGASPLSMSNRWSINRELRERVKGMSREQKREYIKKYMQDQNN